MTRAELLSLADRVEALEGPDREVDEMIARFTMPNKKWAPSISYGHGVYYNANGSCSACPAYTKSLDAAMILVPEGWRYIIGGGGGSRCAVDLAPKDFDDGCTLGEAATPALALTAAALRAHAERMSYG